MMNYIIAIGLFQALLTMMLLLIGRKRRPARSLILGLLVCVFTHLALKFFIYALADYPVLRQGFHTFIGLAYGPVLWMIALKVKDDAYMPATHWYLLLPAMLGAIAYLGIVCYMVSTGNEPADAIHLYNNIILWLILASGLFYPLSAYLLSRKLPAFWKTEQQLLRHLSVLFMLLALIGVSSFALHAMLPPAKGEQIVVRIISYSLLLLVCIAILNYLIRVEAELKSTAPESSLMSGLLPQVFPDVKLLQLSGLPALADVAEYEAPKIMVKEAPLKSGLGAKQQQQIVQQLEELMQQRKYYTDPDIDLDQLSALAKISRHHISEALNQYAHKTFYQFLNEYRVQEILQTLDKCKTNNIRPNLLSLAFEAGFNSKSSFNLYFKKSTGLTPSEYLKQA